MYIICDEYGIIKIANKNFIKVLGYSSEEINDQFIGFIMSPYLSFLHKEYLLPMYRSMTVEQTNTSHDFLSSMSIRDRPLIIYTKSREHLCVHLYIDHYVSEQGGLFRLNITSFEKMDSTFIYTADLHPPEKSLFRESSIDMMVICIDMKDSTQYLIQYGTTRLIDMHTKFHRAMVDLIRTEFYPYLYIHEIMGDGFCLVMNIEWGYSFPRFCASMVYSFLTELYQQTNSIIPFRAGVCYGKLHYGYLDRRLRFFGETIHRASRYEHECNTLSFCSDSNYYEKLLSEGMFTQTTYQKETIHLRGIGPTELFRIDYVEPSKTESYKEATISLSLTGTPVMSRTPSPEKMIDMDRLLETNVPQRTLRTLRTLPVLVKPTREDTPIFFDKDCLEDM